MFSPHEDGLWVPTYDGKIQDSVLFVRERQENGRTRVKETLGAA